MAGCTSKNVIFIRAVTVPIFRFGFGRFLAKKTAVLVFRGFGFSIQKMSNAQHITLVENDQTSNHAPYGQHCYDRL